MTPTITGIGWITPSGMGRGRDHGRFDAGNGPLPRVTAQSVFGAPSKHFGRMDDYSKMGLAAITFALRDAGLEHFTEKRGIGMIAGTVFGCLHTDDDYYQTAMPEDGALASPNLFAYTLPNTYLGEAAIRFGLTGTGFVINDTDTSGMNVIKTALHSLMANELDKVLCGICDPGPLPFMSPMPGTFTGALFYMIETAPQNPDTVYGELALDKAGNVLFENRQIATFAELSGCCVAKTRTDPI